MSQELQSIKISFKDEIKKNITLTIVMGVILALAGLLAMGAPLVAGLSLALVVGIILLIGGVGQLVFAIKTGKGFFITLLGVLTVILGAYMIGNPGTALASLTLFLAAYLIVSGFLEIIMSLQYRTTNGWEWSLFSGILAALLGIMIWNQFPLSGAWAIGILIGVRLFFSGWALFMFGFAARSLRIKNNLQ